MIRGDFVSHDLVLDLLKKEINANQNNTNGFLIDGSPRERQQSIDLEKKLVPVDLILLFDASEATLLKRLLNRTKSSARVDDNEETIRKRLAMYKKNNCEFVVELYPYKYKRVRNLFLILLYKYPHEFICCLDRRRKRCGHHLQGNLYLYRQINLI